jgi:cytochrome b561
MTQHHPFTLLSRILHWTMAALILVMLFIGIGMVASLSHYHWLLSIHRPLGILVLALVAVRLVNRLLNPPPPLPIGECRHGNGSPHMARTSCSTG